MRDTIILYDTLLYGIELPAAVATAINRKTEQYYISEEYKFRVEREKRESERKKIEAEGIREFQQIVSQGISNSYLRWRGIEATLQLSQSTNSKVVIIGRQRRLADHPRQRRCGRTNHRWHRAERKVNGSKPRGAGGTDAGYWACRSQQRRLRPLRGRRRSKSRMRPARNSVSSRCLRGYLNHGLMV